MKSLLLLLVVFGAACAGNSNYRVERPPELGPPDFELKPYCCNVVENVMAELKERVEKSGGNALKLKEILDHCIKKLLVVKTALVKQIEHFDFWIKKNGLPERIGPPGDKGDRGPKGLAGLEGPKGQKGEPGKKGLDGSQGHPGRMGRKGDVGATGERGEKGDPGVRGPTTYVRGPKGGRGAKGPPGEDGPQGPRGPVGERGEKGEHGEPGNPGPQGWCLRDTHKQCKAHHDEDEDDHWKHPRAEPEPEPELIPNPSDFEEPDAKRVYHGISPVESKDLKDPKICPSCVDDSEPEPESRH